MKSIIPISKPSITEKEISYVTDAIKNGWGSSCYDYIYRFQDKFKNYLKSKFCIATSSCTGAMHLALLSIGITDGDEVICPDITWIASVSPITYLNATPIFVDVDKKNWCIDPDRIEKAITNKTKAIIAVHLYGNVCDMDRIMNIAKRHNLYVIEDAAEGLGSVYKGKKCGSIGDIGVFSFHGTKTMTTGEGGALVTNNEFIFKNASVLNEHGRDSNLNKTFWMEKIGYKYKISNLQAALGFAQLERIDELVSRKREIFFNYQNLLKNVDDIEMNYEDEFMINSFWMPTILIGENYNFNREHLFNSFKENNIDSRPFFFPLSSLPMFKKKNNINSYQIYNRAFNLPSFHDITNEQQKNVIDVLISFLNK
jgi:perosamine synthetase